MMVKRWCYIQFVDNCDIFISSILAMHDGMIMNTRWNDGKNVMLSRVFIIVPSRFHHRLIAYSQSYNRIIAPLYFHHRSIAFHHGAIACSSSYYIDFINQEGISSLYLTEISFCMRVFKIYSHMKFQADISNILWVICI
jgi:hypothetical protein